MIESETISLVDPKEEEKIVSEFEQGLGRIQDRLLGELRLDFSDLEYHNPEHSLGVAKNIEFFLSDLPIEQVSERMQKIAPLIGMGHDIDQTYQNPWPKAPNGIGSKRVRNTGAIEEASFQRMMGAFEEEGVELTGEEQEIVHQAVRATIPGFDINLKTVIQPHLYPDSHPVTWATAAADLGSSGYNAAQFFRDGDAMFGEDRSLPALDTLDDAALQELYNEAIAWTANQVTSAQGQQAYWNRPEVPDFIKSKMQSFETSIALCQERLERRRALFDDTLSIAENLKILLDDMHFNRFESE